MLTLPIKRENQPHQGVCDKIIKYNYNKTRKWIFKLMQQDQSFDSVILGSKCFIYSKSIISITTSRCACVATMNQASPSSLLCLSSRHSMVNIALEALYLSCEWHKNNFKLAQGIQSKLWELLYRM